MRGNLYSDIPDCDFHVEGRVGNSLVFCKQKRDLLVKTANRSHRSFFMSDVSELLTVPLFK